MTSVLPGPRWRWRLLFAAAFVASGYLGRLTILDGQSLSLIWPAAGVVVFWFLTLGARWWSVDTLLLAFLTFVVNRTTGASDALGLVFVVTNVVQAHVVVDLVRRWSPHLWGAGGSDPISAPRELARFTVAATLGTLLGAVMGAGGLLLVMGAIDPIASIVWFGRNLCGMLAVATVCLLVGERYAATGRWRDVFDLGIPGRGERIGVALFTVASFGAAFAFASLPLAFPLLVSTVWVGLRFTTVASVLHSLVLGVATVVLTLQGLGPFVIPQELQVGALLAQFFLGMLVVTGLVLATANDQRRALTRQLDEAQRQAATQAQVLETIISSLGEGLGVVEDGGRVVLENPAMARLAGRSLSGTEDGIRGLAVHRPDGTEVPYEERAPVRALRGEHVSDMDIVYGDPSSTARILSVSATPLPAREDEPPRAVMLLRDVTAERTRQRELSAFAGVVAHDLRNPLAAIEGWSELLADELAERTELSEPVARIQHAAGRMRSLIDDLLAHVRSRDSALAPQRLDLADLVRDVVRTRGAEDDVTVGALPAVHADPVLARQLLANLVGNALKYVAPGQCPRVVVAGEPAGDRVRVSITDNGLGVPPEDRERIFEEFQRVHGDVVEGTGLGLAICRRIVERHGGTIAVRSRSDGVPGSVFTFDLPAAAEGQVQTR